MQNPEKETIKQYFEDHHGKRFTAFDLEDELGIHLNTCEKILSELVEEGEIE